MHGETVRSHSCLLQHCNRDGTVWFQWESNKAEQLGSTGLKKGRIYRLFSSKEELAAEAFVGARRLAQRGRGTRVNVSPGQTLGIGKV
jgi:hypothetical protein